MTENNQPDVGPYRQRFSQIATMMRLPHVEDATGLDPTCCPGTGHPEPGGIAMREMNAIMRGCRGIDMIGGDVSEVSPPFDTSAMTALAAALAVDGPTLIDVDMAALGPFPDASLPPTIGPPKR